MTWRSPVIPLTILFVVWANPSAANPQFEVASIRPSAPGAGGSTFYNPTRERFEVDSITVRGLIAYAFDVREFQIDGAAGWAAADRYDVIAKPEGDVGAERIRAMVQDLLVERMGLKLHKETREMSVLGLSLVQLAKGGTKLQHSAAPGGPTMRGGPGRITGQNLTMGMLASLLADKLERPVLDRTGVQGQFDIRLEWTPEESAGTGPSVFAALQEQLGLRLETERAPVGILVIDHVERPSPN